jgi:hypothetical protein
MLLTIHTDMPTTRLIILLLATLCLANCKRALQPPLYDGKLVEADYWSAEPKILSAGLGFVGILGIPDKVTQETALAAGAAWYNGLRCTGGEAPTVGMQTGAASKSGIQAMAQGKQAVDYGDGLPIVFSWPIATETLQPGAFQFTLNTGEVVLAPMVMMLPNWEHNERNVAVAVGHFGNRLPSTDPAARFPVRLDIVDGGSPLFLVGPGGQRFNATGLSWTTTSSPYDPDNGPRLVGAKLNYCGTQPQGEGMGGGAFEQRQQNMPNDEFALYGGGDFRLRMLTTGGFSPDGVTGVKPDQYEDFFRLHVLGEDGDTVLLEKTGVDYAVKGGQLKVLGLADLGQKTDPAKGIHYDDCYQEDRDNYIDIILVGDEAAARNIRYLEIPSLAGGYRAFYNPGGPGPTPAPGTRYTQPGPPHLEPVIIALDDPMRVSRK